MLRSVANKGVYWDSWFYRYRTGWLLDAKEGSYKGATPNDLTATAYYAYSTLIIERKPLRFWVTVRKALTICGCTTT